MKFFATLPAIAYGATYWKGIGMWRLVYLPIAIFVLLGAPLSLAEDKTPADSGRVFETAISSLLKRYCYECHAGDVTEGDIDLAPFTSIAEIRKQTKLWVKVREMLDSGQMPPKDSLQPSDAERVQLQAWVRTFLTAQARANAGDPGPVLLRRLNNAEYNYTIRDLTGVDALDPTQEFPVDGASGEGFTNTGSGQGMSPALVQKYLDAAKNVAEHVVLLPNGIRFSSSISRADQTNEALANIQALYRRYTVEGGGAAVDLQGIKFDTNQGGLLPLERYLAALLAERDALQSGRKSLETVAKERSLSPQYLTKLWATLAADQKPEGSLFLAPLRRRWRQAQPDDAAALAGEIRSAQQTLWKFNPVGHIGREGGPTAWMEPISPVTTHQQLRVKFATTPPGKDAMLYLAANDLADGNEHDFVVWQQGRIEFPGEEVKSARPPILLCDVRAVVAGVEQTIKSETARTKEYLQAVVAVKDSSLPIADIAEQRKLNAQLLARWTNLLQIGERPTREITGHFQQKLTRIADHEALNGWGRPETPSLTTNRSHEAIKFSTLTLPGRSVSVHPSPQLDSVIAWRSPIDGPMEIQGLVADADSNCGNGVAWRVEIHTATSVTVVAAGTIESGRDQRFKTEKPVPVRTGDVVSLVVGARDESHVCDTTHVSLTLSEIAGEKRRWDLATDIVDKVLESNPLADSYENKETWHFCAVEAKTTTLPQETLIPAESTLYAWRRGVAEGESAAELARLASQVQATLSAQGAVGLKEPESKLRRTLLSWRGPLDWLAASKPMPTPGDSLYGMDPAMFGKHPGGAKIADSDLCIQAPKILEIRLPTELVAGGEFIATAAIHDGSDAEGSVQVQASLDKPALDAVSLSTPILVAANSRRQKAIEAALDEFRDLFPPALCYTRIVPVDEVVTLTLYHREDHHLKRLMLSEAEAAELDRLWDELLFISQEPLKLVVAYEQIVEFATQDRPDLVKMFAGLRQPIEERAESFRRRIKEAEPRQLDAVLRFARRAWRRTLQVTELQALRDFYVHLRRDEMAHDEAIRLVLARILTSPAFLYKLEQPAEGDKAAPVTDLELATRLSYFLWSSAPDEALRQAAEAGKLHNDAELLSHTRRMLGDARVRRLAVEFGCQWLQVRNFDHNDEKSEAAFPEFAELRDDMYEETVQFLEDMIRNDRSILSLLDADHTFLNESLAKHYGIEEVRGAEWRRVDGVRSRGRGGVLSMATYLASQSGASRTSPILRGNWVYETLLGKRLPRPPANVPQLPETPPSGLTERQLIEQHSSVPACAKCHVLVDPYGFALEQYDAIGRLRPTQADTKAALPDGQAIEGVDGLREYLMTSRRDEVVRQFCRKLLGYALGREVQLSDEPLLDEMQAKLKADGFRLHIAVESIVTSPQFRNIRGQPSVE